MEREGKEQIYMNLRSAILVTRFMGKDLDFHFVKVKGPVMHLCQVSQWVAYHD